MTRPFRFGLQCVNMDSGAAWIDLARKVEALGYSSLHLCDHFLGPGPQLAKTNHPPVALAPTPAMATALAVTATLRVGCRVYCHDYRHPVILAKEAATMDLLSDGRLELGLGAGWIGAEYEAAGMPFDRAGVRIRRLEEYIAIVKVLMSGGQIEHHGEFFDVFGFSALPEPVQKPHPPIMIGGGARKILGLAGREADIVSLNYNNRSGVMGPDGFSCSSAVETDRKIQWVKSGAGDRFGELEIELGGYLTVVTDNQRAVAEEFSRFLDTTSEDVLDNPHAFIGSVDYICEKLIAQRERYGISYITVPEDGGSNLSESFAPVIARLAGR